MLIWQAKRTDEVLSDEYKGYICVAPDFATASVAIPKLICPEWERRVDLKLPLTDAEFEQVKEKWAFVKETDRPIWVFTIVGEVIDNSETRILMVDYNEI